MAEVEATEEEFDAWLNLKKLEHEFSPYKGKPIYKALMKAAVARLAEREVCAEILAIMDTYHEQYPNIDTPGGFEHMGDVWGKFVEWETKLRGEKA